MFHADKGGEMIAYDYDDCIYITPTDVVVCDPPSLDYTECQYQRDFKYENHRSYQEHFFRLAIGTIFNIFAASTYRRMLFSKSGFVGRAGKKRKGKI